MRIRNGVIVVAAMLVAALTAVAAIAAGVKNHGFESGHLNGWQKDRFPAAEPHGNWITYDGPFSQPKTRGDAPSVPAPPEGDFGALTIQDNPSAVFLSQVVDLAPGKHHELSFKLAYFNDYGPPRRLDPPPNFITPNTFRTAGKIQNQQFRMDVMKPGAKIKSLRSNQVLKRVYRTEEDDRNKRGFRKITANLTPFAGKEVRLRFAVAVTQNVLNVAIDDVKVETTN